MSGEASIMVNPILAVVCDIRGFTDFTSTVDSVNRSEQFPSARKKDLLDAYDDLVDLTQRTAVEKILQPLAWELRNQSTELSKGLDAHRGKQGPLPCALKSTGDGFLIAIELVQNNAALSWNLQAELAHVLVKGVSALVLDAKDNGEFRSKLKQFFDRWEDYLAMPLEANTFRVAGAVALGTGQVSEENVPPDFAIATYLNNALADNDPGDGPSKALQLKSDAYGHGVNLAFRLCDRAGRERDMLHEKSSPYVLFDRRVGQLLITPERPASAQASDLFPFRMRAFHGFERKVCRLTFKNPLKGIDELWCYGLNESDPSIVEQAQSTHSQG